MKSNPLLTSSDLLLIKRLVALYGKNEHLVKNLLGSVSNDIENSPALRKLIHTTKYRLKDPGHLRSKLARKISEARAEGKEYGVSEENLFEKINDLAGARIIHLHTEQIAEIHKALCDMFEENRYELAENPTAHTWDFERSDYFKQMGMSVSNNRRMYTSVHYVVKSNSRTPVTCEIQVRTLAEELWGEVDHSINYPEESTSEPCRDQIKVLARVTSSASRLVDSIFKTHEHHKRRKR